MPTKKRKRTEEDDTDEGSVTGLGRQTRSATQEERNAKQRKTEEEARKQAEELRLRREQALRLQPPAPSGNRGDGSLHISFLQMGQGDCCLIATPKGRVIVIDCGSDSHDGEDETTYNKRITDAIYSEKFLKNQNKIDVLILTHPDTDHYNKAKIVLDKNVEIHNVYHSANFADYSAGQTSSWIYLKAEHFSFIKAVTHNRLKLGLIQINKKDVQPADETNKVDRLDGQGGILIVDEENCKISILASNVYESYLHDGKSISDNSNATNRGSIVTLIEIFKKKILICGDATRNTEHYLIETSGDRIADVSILQAPHHGSDNTSSSTRFVDKTNPLNVTISAGKQVNKDHLPSEATISRYEARQLLSGRADVANHEIFYWQKGALGSYFHTSKFTKRSVYVTGSNSTFEKRFEKPS